MLKNLVRVRVPRLLSAQREKIVVDEGVTGTNWDGVPPWLSSDWQNRSR